MNEWLEDRTPPMLIDGRVVVWLHVSKKRFVYECVCPIPFHIETVVVASGAKAMKRLPIGSDRLIDLGLNLLST